MDPEEEIDFTKLKYVLYARKSRTDEAAQVRSIPDQIADCLKLATDLGIKVIKVLQEAKSAKKPHQRPIFKQMISDIKKGLYDGILAWNPDRLARNMLEGGEIIDLIDQDIIKDLKFKTHHFTKDANGKMLLGMAFVLSKQYSDDLSQKVTRGVQHRFAEGKTPTPKHGYLNEEGIYRRDGKNFNLIRAAWEMRKEEISIEDIVEYLNKNDYTKEVKSTGKKIRMSKQILSDIFHDPFYYGVLLQAGKEVDLRLAYNFEPAVSEEDYNLVQQLTYRKIKPSKPHRMAFYPLRLMAICAFCNEFMRVGPSSGKTNRYLYYRCDNPNCVRKKKSIRAKVVFEYIYTFLQNGLNFSQADYDSYYSNIIALTDQKRQQINVMIHSKQGAIKRIDQEIKDLSLGLLKSSFKESVVKTGEQKVDELEKSKSDLEQEIATLKSKLTDPMKDKLSVEQFLNLSKNAARIVQSANGVLKDTICRLIFLNFLIDEEKVLSHQLKEPFVTMVKQRQLLVSRGPGN